MRGVCGESARAALTARNEPGERTGGANCDKASPTVLMLTPLPLGREAMEAKEEGRIDGTRTAMKRILSNGG